MKIGWRLLHKRRHFENAKLLAGNDHVFDIFASEDMDNISPCIFRCLMPVHYVQKISPYLSNRIVLQESRFLVESKAFEHIPAQHNATTRAQAPRISRPGLQWKHA